MKSVYSVLSLVVAFGMFASSGNAALILSFENPTTFIPNGGIQSINVFARSSLPAGESVSTIGADFTLGGGAVFNTPNAGTFGGAGFTGFGNINPGGSSFDRETAVGSANVGYLSITFQNFAQQFTNTPTPFATLLVNPLSLQSFSISATNVFAGADSLGNASIVATAVPEPTTLAMLAIVGVAGMARIAMRRRRVKSLAN